MHARESNRKVEVQSGMQCLQAQPHVKEKHRVNRVIIIDRLCDVGVMVRITVLEDARKMGYSSQHCKVTATRPRKP